LLFVDKIIEEISMGTFLSVSHVFSISQDSEYFNMLLAYLECTRVTAVHRKYRIPLFIQLTLATK